MNFSYLNKYPEFKKLQKACESAEGLYLNDPDSAVICCRSANEYVIKFIYKNCVEDVMYDITTFEMLSDPRFIKYINNESLLNAMHYIRKIGNFAAHEGGLGEEDAINALKNVHFVVGEFACNIGLIDKYDEFTLDKENNNKTAEKTNDLDVDDQTRAKYAPRMRETNFVVTTDIHNEENRTLFLRASLREAGWKIATVDNLLMPSCACINVSLDNGDTASYVLTGNDNRPLAIVEYVDSTRSIIDGRLSACKKADELEKKYGYKPIVYYTNGYSIFCIDQLGYAPRKVFEIHSIEEMELLKQRRNSRKDISDPTIDDAITNRDYQKEAIRAVCNAFSKNRRRSLIVMATGTGKTRVSISIVDILMKAGWVKNVLFLADRNSLVRQAHKNFNKLLHNVPSSIYAGGTLERDPNARIIFSTYQTMISLINDDTREFGIGRFDLIIVDEAHRSIFSKYGSLFEYFDCLMVGLTATPRSEDNKSSYDIFGLKNGEPDYAYELTEAVNDKYLVGFFVNDRTSDLLKRGVKYDDLSDQDKRKLETLLEDEDNGILNDEGVIDFSKARIRNSIGNVKTIDAMLADLLKNGLKVENGDKLGKTIIFAENHYQAEEIVKRYNKIYEKNQFSDFCKLIDSKTDNNLTLIDRFSERDSYPQIAVSVDMLDTGIDVPDILNLVFFKPVKSRIKFLQMIGRGTRLSPDIFGPGEDKKGFLIFDYFDNFNYFDTHFSWQTGGSYSRPFNGMSQTETIFNEKLGILCNLRRLTKPSDFDAKYEKELTEEFITKTNELSTDDIRVQNNMIYVNTYRSPLQWEKLDGNNVDIIKEHIIPLYSSLEGRPKVKAFDSLVYFVEQHYDLARMRVIQKSKVKLNELELQEKIIQSFGSISRTLNHMLKELEKIKTIPEITKNLALITSMKDFEYLIKDFSYEKCEYARKQLRELMNYIPDKKEYYFINVDDTVMFDDNSKDFESQVLSYEEKVNKYLADDSNPLLAKIRNLDPLSEDEKNKIKNVFENELGTEQECSRWTNGQELLPHIRKIINFTDEAIQTKFGSFFNRTVLDEKQYEFMSNIIACARANGDITFTDLQVFPEFADQNIPELFGTKMIHIRTMIDGLHKVVM